MSLVLDASAAVDLTLGHPGLAGLLTIQDGAYVALAEGLGCPLVTTDSRLAATAADLVRVATPDS
ncbi:MAG: hypothetical protein JST64_08775 [Actinobacteria bacterium]|nr:hypothetical protein [Actinomycetota bacterium]